MLFSKKKKQNDESAYRGSSRRRSSQSVIPFDEWYSNGIFRIGKNRYSIICEFDNAGYLSRTDAEQERKYRAYHRALCELPDYVTYEECIYNIPVDTDTYVEAIASKSEGFADATEADFFRVQRGFAEGLDREFSLKRYLVALSTYTEDGEDPTNRLLDAVSALVPRFREMDSTLRVLTPEEVFAELYKYFNPLGGSIPPIPADIYKKGLAVQDFICADSFEFKKDYIRIGDAYVRILSATSYGAEAVDILTYRLMSHSLAAFMTKYVEHVEKDKALEMIKADLDDAEVKRDKSLRHSKRDGGAAFVSRNVQGKIEACGELLDALGGNEELLRQTVYVMVAAESLEELRQATNRIKNAAISVHTTMRTVNSFPERTLQAMLPLACSAEKPARHQVLLSSAAAVMTPYSYESRFDKDGFFYGYHSHSGEPVIINRTLGTSCHGFVLGATGSGKGMFVKHEISNIFYQPFCQKDRIIIVDAVGEYVPLANAFGGKVIDVSPASDTHLNPLYLSKQRKKELGDAKARAEKSAFLIALLSRLKGDGGLEAAEKTVVDTAYAAACKHSSPTLETLAEEIGKMAAQGNVTAVTMCEWLKRYYQGSVTLFQGKDTADEGEDRLTVYDLKGLSSGDLLDAVMLAMLERIEETVMRNFAGGHRTYIYIDELHRYFDAERNPYAAARLARFFSELRKFGAIITGITQLPKAVVDSPDGATMLSNSRFIVMAELDTRNVEVVSELYDLNEDMRRTLAVPDVGQYVIRTSKAPMSVRLLYPGKEEADRNLMYDLFNTSPDYDKGKEGEDA